MPTQSAAASSAKSDRDRRLVAGEGAGCGAVLLLLRDDLRSRFFRWLLPWLLLLLPWWRFSDLGGVESPGEIGATRSEEPWPMPGATATAPLGGAPGSVHQSVRYV